MSPPNLGQRLTPALNMETGCHLIFDMGSTPRGVTEYEQFISPEISNFDTGRLLGDLSTVRTNGLPLELLMKHQVRIIAHRD